MPSGQAAEEHVFHYIVGMNGGYESSTEHTQNKNHTVNS